MISDSWRKDISCLVYPWDMFLREVFLRTIIQATNHLKGTRGIFPGGYCQEPIIFGIIFQEQLSREQLSGGNFPRWQLSGGQFSLGAIIVGGNCPGDNNPGGGDNHAEGYCLGDNYPGGNAPRGKLSGNLQKVCHEHFSVVYTFRSVSTP